MTTALILPASVIVVAAPGWICAWLVRRRQSPSVKSWDHHVEDAIRVARPGRVDWQ